MTDRLAEIKALSKGHLIPYGAFDWLISEVERLKENHVINVKEAWSLGMERAAVVVETHLCSMDELTITRMIAAAIRAEAGK